MDATLEKFLAAKPYARNTRDRYRRVLEEFVSLPNIPTLTPSALLNWIDRPGWGNSQQCLALIVCKCFLRFAFGETHQALTARLRRRASKPQRTLTPAQATKLLCHFNTTTLKGKRDLAIAALAIDTGLRLAELCSLKIKDYHPEALTLSVIIKGGDWDTATYSEQTALFIDDWLTHRPKPADTVFSSTRTGKPLTREGLQTIVKKWGKEIGLKLSPHDLRRTFATLATRNGAPGRIVQRAGRWADLQMVTLYTRQLEQEAIKPYLPIRNLMQET